MAQVARAFLFAVGVLVYVSVLLTGLAVALWPLWVTLAAIKVVFFMGD
jgi:hypothetical protein